MAEVKHIKIKSIYSQLKGIYANLSETSSVVPNDVAGDINAIIDELSSVADIDYSRHKMTADQITGRSRSMFRAVTVKTRLSSLISRLEAEYDLGEQASNASQAPFVIYNTNQNTNTISINVNYTIEQLIKSADSDDEKAALAEIKDELEKPNASWDKIKRALGWIVNYSKDLSLKVIPIVLDHYIKRG